MFTHLTKKSSIWFICTLILLISVSACIEVAPPPPAPEIPTAEPNDMLHIGIGANLSALQPLLTEQFDLAEDNDTQPFFISNSNRLLQQQLLAGTLDGIFVYQKPAAPALWTMPIALDSIAIITHPDIMVDTLSRSDLQQIFAGDLQNWQTFSGQEQAISVFVMGSKSEIRLLFNERVMENRPFDVSAVVPLNTTALIQAVAETKGGIGFLPTSVIQPEDAVQIVPVDRFFPQFNTVRSQQYPLTIPIYMATNGEPHNELRQLAAWLQSAEGQQRLSANFVQIGN